MYQNQKILCFIGARGGSQGLRNKNILDFGGKPMVAWTIGAGRGSKYVDRTIVSTNNAEIAEISRACGAEVPFMRPEHLATHDASLADGIYHCIDWLKSNQNAAFDYVVALLPTSPLRTAQHLDDAIEQYFLKRKTCYDTLGSVSVISNKIGKLMFKRKNGYFDFCFEVSKTNPMRQGLPEYYLPNGAIFLAPILPDRSQPLFNGDKMLAYQMPTEISVDIDTVEDLDLALTVFHKRGLGVTTQL